MQAPLFSRLLARAHWTISTTRCELCGAWPTDTTWAVCNACIERFAPVRPRCLSCALPVNTLEAICPDCHHHPPPWQRCLAAVDYDSPWSGLIQRFKFHGEVGWSRVFAHLMVSSLAHESPSEIAQTDWIMPVPMHPHALGQRGYNQGWLLCNALKKNAALSHLIGEKKFRSDVLLKVQHTQAQHRLGQKSRRDNLAQAFAVAPHAWADLQGRTVTLVDDILTTGATLRAATTVLRQQGAAHVQVWVTARTPAPKGERGGASLQRSTD